MEYPLKYRQMRLDLGRSYNKLSAFNNALLMAQAASAASAAASIRVTPVSQ
jgi:hypothetical protein